MWAEKKAPLPDLGPTGSLPSLAAQPGADDTVRGVTVLEHSRDPGCMRKALGPKTQQELTPANKHGVRLEVDRAPVEPSGRTQPCQHVACSLGDPEAGSSNAMARSLTQRLSEVIKVLC